MIFINKNSLYKFIFIFILISLACITNTACNQQRTDDIDIIYGDAPTVEAIITDEQITIITDEQINSNIDYGDVEKPIRFAFPKETTSVELRDVGQTFLNILTEETGLIFEGVIPTSDAALIEAFGSDQVQIGLLPALTYILARQKGYAEAALINQKLENTYYSQIYFVANIDSSIKPADNIPSSDADIPTLLQLKDKKGCFTDPYSGSGYVIPFLYLNKIGIMENDINKLYLHGRGPLASVLTTDMCDFAVIDFEIDKLGEFEVQGAQYIKNNIIVIFQIEYPNDNISYATNFPKDLRNIITAAIVRIGNTEEGSKILINLFDFSGVNQIDNTIYEPLISLTTGIDLNKYVK